MRDVLHLTEDQRDEDRIGIIFYYLLWGSTSLNMTGRILASSMVYGSRLWLREPLARLVHQLQPFSVSLSVSL